jgi:hypothetical protein
MKSPLQTAEQINIGNQHMTILKAEITLVKLGNLEVEGLLLEDNSFGLSVIQINEQLISFSTSNNTLSRDLKRLLGNSFSPIKVKTKQYKQLINAVRLADLETLILELTIAGNKQAQELARSLVGLSLNQLFSDAFGKKFEAEDRQNYLKARQETVIQRRTETDGIKFFLQLNPLENSAKYYGGCTNNTYLALFGMTKKSLCESRNIEYSKEITPRDYLTDKELYRLAEFENYAAIQMIKFGKNPLDAVKSAKDFYC